MPWDPHARKGRSGLPPDWARLRLRVLDRDERRCQIRGPRCTVVATDVDHAGHRDDHSLGNLRSACGPCHRQHTAAQGNAAKARLRALRKRPEGRHPGSTA
jgi:5-methylcytosine-specific restriction endonuclease McrA